MRDYLKTFCPVCETETIWKNSNFHTSDGIVQSAVCTCCGNFVSYNLVDGLLKRLEDCKSDIPYYSGQICPVCDSETTLEEISFHTSYGLIQAARCSKCKHFISYYLLGGVIKSMENNNRERLLESMAQMQTKLNMDGKDCDMPLRR